MSRSQEEVEYTVILVFPGYGEERENAEAIVEAALEWLNNNKEEPGFRFAPPVSAHLEIVPDTDEARARIETDEYVAMVLLHDLDVAERNDMIRHCRARHIPTCFTEDGPRPRRRKGPWKIVFRNKPDKDDVPSHRIVASTLTAPIDEEDEETGDRVGQLIAVMALGVMEHHWGKNMPSYGFDE
jgi:hypothetical protein